MDQQWEVLVPGSPLLLAYQVQIRFTRVSIELMTLREGAKAWNCVSLLLSQAAWSGSASVLRGSAF